MADGLLSRRCHVPIHVRHAKLLQATAEVSEILEQSHINKETRGPTNHSVCIAYGFLRVDEFPNDSLTRPITSEMQDGVGLFAIQALDRVTQSTFGILLSLRRQWIINTRWPTLFLEYTENGFLIFRRPLKLLNECPVDSEHTSFGVP